MGGPGLWDALWGTEELTGNAQWASTPGWAGGETEVARGPSGKLLANTRARTAARRLLGWVTRRCAVASEDSDNHQLC